MPLLSFDDFRAALPAKGGLIGLDPGTKIIGVAATDPERMVASPIEGIKRSKMAADAARIFELYDARNCAALVIGLARNMDGSEGPSAQRARAFARNLLAIRDTPILMWDERMSTAAVTRGMIDHDTSRARRAEIVDQLAAAYVLQGLADRLRAAHSERTS
ncbi:MAG: Holliday junction resolvase RuvX [Caulobacterales bacterium]